MGRKIALQRGWHDILQRAGQIPLYPGSPADERKSPMSESSAPLCLDRWWPARFGAHPDWTGAADGVRYAYFSRHDVMVVDNEREQTILDTAGRRLKSAVFSHWTMKLEFQDE